jgi:flavine halogenase
MGKKLSEDEVQRALDFCVNLFSPTTPEQHENVRRKILESQWVPDEHEEYEEITSTRPAPLGTQNLPSTNEVPMTASHRSGIEFDTPVNILSRFMDVKSPVIDPSALTKLFKSRLSLFRRTNSNGSIKSVASSRGSPPPSPVSAVFSFMSGVSSLSSGPDSEEAGEEDEVKMVLDKVNARRVIHSEFSEGVHSLEQEDVCGMSIRLKKGDLGLNWTTHGVS